MAEDVHLSRLKSFINECGGVTLAAWKLNVRPSTLKKLLTGQVLSAPTREKLGDIIKKNSNAKPSKARGELKIIRSKLRGMIKNEVDLVEASSRFNVNPSTIRKILRGVPVYYNAQMKIRAALEAKPSEPVAAKPSMVGRLNEVYRLYEQEGTLEAVGRRIGVTRERVRQLLVKGSQLGLFNYKPFEYPFVPKEKLLEDYKNQLSLIHVAKINSISTTYLHKLFTAYGISGTDLRSAWLAGKKIRYIGSYNRIKDELGHHPTTTELQQQSKSWRGLYTNITRLWGSYDAFRQELNIPKPPGFREATRPWHEHRQRLALIRRMQYLDRIRECLAQSAGSLSASEIAIECGLKTLTVQRLLGLLIATGGITREGRSGLTKYRLLKV